MEVGQDITRVDAMLKEYDAIRKEIGDSQNARLNILGFTVAAVGTILGLTAQRVTPISTAMDYFALALVAFSLGLLITAQILTINYSQGIINTGAYIQIFIEPHIQGLKWEIRLHQRRKHRQFLFNWSRTSITLGVYYAFLTIAVTAIAFVTDLYRFPFALTVILLLCFCSLVISSDLILHKTGGWKPKWVTDDKD